MNEKLQEIFTTVDRPLEQVNAEELLIKLLDVRRELTNATVDFDFTQLSPAGKHLVIFSAINALVNLVKQRI